MNRHKNVAARPATYCAANGELSRTNARTSLKPTPSSSDPDKPTRDISNESQCFPNTEVYKIAHSVHEAARDVARRIAMTPEYVRSRHEHKKVEILFAHLKRILQLDRLRLRGMRGATDEFTLAAGYRTCADWGNLHLKGRPPQDRYAVSSKSPQFNPRTQQQQSMQCRKTI